jgi:hypothetical protein
MALSLIFRFLKVFSPLCLLSCSIPSISCSPSLYNIAVIMYVCFGTLIFFSPSVSCNSVLFNYFSMFLNSNSYFPFQDLGHFPIFPILLRKDSVLEVLINFLSLRQFPHHYFSAFLYSSLSFILHFLWLSISYVSFLYSSFSSIFPLLWQYHYVLMVL